MRYTVYRTNPVRGDVHHPEPECEIRQQLIADGNAKCATMTSGVSCITVMGVHRKAAGRRGAPVGVKLQMCIDCNYYRAANAIGQR